MMALTVPSTSTIERVRSDNAFAKSLLVEAVTLFLNGEPDTSRLLLRDLVNGTLGFEQLAVETGTPAKSLHRMLSVKGNPSMDNLSILFHVIAQHLGVTLTKTRSSIKAA